MKVKYLIILVLLILSNCNQSLDIDMQIIQFLVERKCNDFSTENYKINKIIIDKSLHGADWYNDFVGLDNYHGITSELKNSIRLKKPRTIDERLSLQNYECIVEFDSFIEKNLEPNSGYYR